MSKHEVSEVHSRRRFLTASAALGGLTVGLGALLTGRQVSGQTGEASGGSKLQEVLKRGKIIVGTGTTAPPFHYKDEKGELVGFDTDVGRIFAKGLFNDLNAIEFVEQKPDARIPNLQTNQVDVVIQFMSVTAQRAQVVEFTIPYYREANTFIIGSKSLYQDVQEMKGKKAKISAVQNVYIADRIHQVLPDAEVLMYDTVSNALLALDVGRADAMQVDLSIANWYTSKFPDKYRLGETIWGFATYSAAVKPGDGRWLRWLNTTLAEALSGRDWEYYAQSFKKHFGAELEPPVAGFPIEYGPRQKQRAMIRK